MLTELRKFVAPEFVFGVGSRHLLLQYIRNFGIARPLVVTDQEVRLEAWYAQMISDLKAEGVQFVEYPHVTINPKDTECTEGATLYLKTNCDAVIAIGGGSVLDGAKGIGILVSNGDEIASYEGVDKVLRPIPPLICVPTTSGSAADVSQFAIITNTKERYKMAHVSKMLVPDVSLIDPYVTLTMPDKVSVDTALDALVHAIESYVSPLASFITDMHALSAIEHVVVNLPLLVTAFDNMAYRTALSRASLEAGLAFSNASLGLVHAIAHSIGGYFNHLAHGELNGAFLQYVIDYNYASSDKYQRVEAIFIQHHPKYAGQKLPEIVRDFTQGITSALGQPLEVYDKGKSVTDTDIRRIAEVAINDPCVLTNPREPKLDEVVEILEKVFKRGD